MKVNASSCWRAYWMAKLWGNLKNCWIRSLPNANPALSITIWNRPYGTYLKISVPSNPFPRSWQPVFGKKSKSLDKLISMSSGKAIIFSAQSGSGKTTIVKHLLATNPRLGCSIPACTRDERGRDEQNGKDYYFLTPVEVKR